MEIGRAKQIMDAEQEISVTFEGDRVWIDAIQEDDGTALVHTLDTGKVSRISVARLHEQ